MKTLLALLIGFIFGLEAARACGMSIPLSYYPTFAAPPVKGHYMKCDAKPDEQCLCIDGINPWYAELIDNEVLDYNTKDQAESCIDEADCIAKFDALVCVKGEKIRTESEVYCTYPVMKIDGKKLVENAQKKADYEARIEAEKLAAAQLAQEKEQACKAIEQMPDAAIDIMFEDLPEIPANANTIAAIKAHLIARDAQENAKRSQQKQHAKNAKKCMSK